MRPHIKKNLRNRTNSTNRIPANGPLSFAMILCCAIGSYGYAIAQENKSAGSGIPHSNACSFTIKEDKGGVATTLTTNFVEMGKPTGGYNCIVDMALFNGRMYLSTADDPLGNWGAKVFYTTDAISFTQALSDASSQGYLRMGVFDNQLWIPDGDPNGMDPSYVYISSTGNSGSFNKTTVLGAVHTFDIIKYNSKAYVANGMASSMGGMCEFDGSNTWNSVNQPSGSFRLKYMTELNGKLFVANANPNSGTDYYLWSGNVSSAPQALDKVAGAGSTYQVYTSSQGRIFWTVVYSGGIHVLQSTDGINWTPSASLDGKFVSDFAELNGKLYALDWKGGLWESSDHITFTLIAPVPPNAPDAFGPLPVSGGYNADARASMIAYNGSIYCGSSTNGKVYKVDITTSVPEAPAQNLKLKNIYPNPFTTSATVHTTNPMVNATMTIVNSFGQAVKTVQNINGTSFTINRDNLPAGLYSIQLRQDNGTVASDKMIITD